MVLKSGADCSHVPGSKREKSAVEVARWSSILSLMAGGKDCVRACSCVNEPGGEGAPVCCVLCRLGSAGILREDMKLGLEGETRWG